MICSYFQPPMCPLLFTAEPQKPQSGTHYRSDIQTQLAKSLTKSHLLWIGFNPRDAGSKSPSASLTAELTACIRNLSSVWSMIRMYHLHQFTHTLLPLLCEHPGTLCLSWFTLKLYLATSPTWSICFHDKQTLQPPQ